MGIRSSIEQTVSHMKKNFRLGRNELSGAIGDELNVLNPAPSHNLLYVQMQKKKMKIKKKN